MSLYSLFREALHAQQTMPGSQVHLNLMYQVKHWLHLVCPPRRGWKVDLDGRSYILVYSVRGDETFFSFMEIKVSKSIEADIYEKIIFIGQKVINIFFLSIFSRKFYP